MEKALAVFGSLLLIVIVAIILALPTMWLWNWLMPHLFGLVSITFWEALGINLFSGILFNKGGSSK